MSLFKPKLITYAGEQDFMLQRKSFVVSFIHLKLKRESKKDHMKVEESKQALDYRMVKIICSLEGGYILEGGV